MMFGAWLRHQRAPQSIHVATPERPCPLRVLDNTENEDQDGGHEDKGSVDGDLFVECICGSEDLHNQHLQVALPELVVLQGVRCDVVWPT